MEKKLKVFETKTQCYGVSLTQWDSIKSVQKKPGLVLLQSLIWKDPLTSPIPNRADYYVLLDDVSTHCPAPQAWQWYLEACFNEWNKLLYWWWWYLTGAGDAPLDEAGVDLEGVPSRETLADDLPDLRPESERGESSDCSSASSARAVFARARLELRLDILNTQWLPRRIAT